MSSGSNLDAAAAESLSALVDGEVDAALAQRICLAWRDDERARATWHAYQLIGDVMRSDDLASTPRRDTLFLERLRAQLVQEPVVLAPQPLPVAPAREASSVGLDTLRRRRTWMASTAVAAGFVAVAGVVVVLRGPDVAPPAALVASGQPATSGAPVVAVVQGPATRAVVVPVPDTEVQAIDGKMVRDARLDRYLAAHKQFAGTSALGVPSSFLRSATVDASNR